MSGHGNDFTHQFPQIAAALATIRAASAVLDGEIFAVDQQGRHSVQRLQSRGAVPAGWQVVFYAFDLLHFKGTSAVGFPQLNTL